MKKVWIVEEREQNIHEEQRLAREHSNTKILKIYNQ